MNQGTTAQTEAQIAQEQLAIKQMQSYYKTRLPALGYAVRTTQENQPGQEQMAGDRAVQSGRVVQNQMLKGVTSRDAMGDSEPGGGSFASRVGGILERGAGGSAQASSVARLGERQGFYGDEQKIVGEGNKMIEQANRGLAIAGGVQASGQQAQDQAAAQRQQAGMSALAALAAAFV